MSVALAAFLLMVDEAGWHYASDCESVPSQASRVRIPSSTQPGLRVPSCGKPDSGRLPAPRTLASRDLPGSMATETLIMRPWQSSNAAACKAVVLGYRWCKSIRAHSRPWQRICCPPSEGELPGPTPGGDAMSRDPDGQGARLQPAYASGSTPDRDSTPSRAD